MMINVHMNERWQYYMLSDTVSNDYLTYMLWQFPTNVTGWICSTLVTSSLLKVFAALSDTKFATEVQNFFVCTSFIQFCSSATQQYMNSCFAGSGLEEYNEGRKWFCFAFHELRIVFKLSLQ